MRVVHVTNDVGTASGVGTFVRRLNDELLKLGVDSRIATSFDAFKAAVQSDSRSPASDALIVHIHGMWLKLHHLASDWAAKNGAQVVWSTHGMTAPWSMRHKWWKKLPAWWLYQRRDLLRADLVHSTTDLEVEWNRRLGLARQCTIPLGADLPLRVRDLRLKTLLFVGRIYPVKAIDRLIQAFQMVPHEGWRLRIVGPDQAGHLAELKKLAGPEVDFEGPKFGADLSSEYEKCACAALVSHTENFGATIVDAMAHGKPVIAGTKTPWKIVADRGCGWWVDNDPETLARAIGEMIALSDDERAARGRKGRALVEEKYTWSAVGKAMREAYGRLGA